jgi:hypothetical protein
MSRTASPFSPRTILAVLVVGAGAFLVFLYAIGAGWDGSSDRNGGAHAAANGLNGYNGLVRLLRARGHAVTLSRSESRLQDPGLLVLTPQLDADGERLGQVIEQRRHFGPTLVILPKWFAIEASQVRPGSAPKGWVMLGGTTVPAWLGDVDWLEDAKLTIGARKQWEGMGLAGRLPAPETVLTIDPKSVADDDGEWAALLPLVNDEQGNLLVGYYNDDGDYPALDEAAGYDPPDEIDSTLWPVVIVIDPDLVNNYGLADLTRARLADALVSATLDDPSLPIVFDLTLAGLGRSQNLLTLAFAPPFLAATLCLLLAALVIAWRAFRRFGPPVAEAPTLAKGKRQLARNGAALVERARRLHLLGPPYAALVTARIAEAFDIREPDTEAREAAIARVLAARGLAADYPERAEALRSARHSAELLRAAGALRTLERTLIP